MCWPCWQCTGSWPAGRWSWWNWVPRRWSVTTWRKWCVWKCTTQKGRRRSRGSVTPSLAAMSAMRPSTVKHNRTHVDIGLQHRNVELPCHTWSLMNRFRTGQGPCRADLHKWGLTQSPSCDCGQRQTMNHIVKTCPLTKFEGGLNLLHEADDDAVIWLESTATAALAK